MLKLTILIEPYTPEAAPAGPERKSPLEQITEALPAILALYKEAFKSPYTATPVGTASTYDPLATVPPIPSVPLYVPPPPPQGAFAAEPDHPFHPDSSVAGPGPAPATPEINLIALKEQSRQRKLTDGFEAFGKLIHAWQENFDVPGAQPDRGQLLRDLCDAPVYGRVLGWVQQMGGLRAAIRKITDPRYVPQPLVDKLAENIAQVASALQYTDLSDLLELAPRLPTITET